MEYLIAAVAVVIGTALITGMFIALVTFATEVFTSTNAPLVAMVIGLILILWLVFWFNDVSLGVK